MHLDNTVIVLLFIIIMCTICSLAVRISKIESNMDDLNDKLKELEKKLDERNSHGIADEEESVLEDETKLLKIIRERLRSK